MTSNEAQPFRKLTVENWRQFDHASFAFDDRLTVLTGRNGSGKSTLLALLAKHFNWNRVYSSAPFRVSKGPSVWSILGRFRRSTVQQDGYVTIGELVYGSGHRSPLGVPIDRPSGGMQRVQYDVQFIAGMQQVEGIYLTSHRTAAGSYAEVANIPTLFGSSEQMLEQFTSEVRNRWLGSWTQKTPLMTLKESLIAAAMFGEGNSSVEGNPEAADVWVGFQEILRALMPQSVGFRRLRVRVPEVIIESESGDFILDEASGGLSAILEISWQIFLRSRGTASFVALIDEPENHLHPSLQRDLLPALLSAFPRVQFIVATHSPFVVTASPEAAVYVLDYNDDRRVEARRLDYANKAASAERTLMQVLGVESTMPRWAEVRFASILDRYLGVTLSTDRLLALRRELAEVGLESEFPVALATATDFSQKRPLE